MDNKNMCSGCIFYSRENFLYDGGQRVSRLGESIVKPVGEVICIRKFPNFSDDTLTNQMLVCNVDVYC